MYVRGSDEQVLARAAGLVEQLPKLKPASVEAVDEIESLLGSPLPHVLRRMYLELGNGGFGPGYGVLGVTGGHMDDMKMTATDIRRHGDFPPNLMAICNWGCAIYSLVEPGADGRIWGYDPNPVEDYEQALFPQSFDLREWFSRWLSGRLMQPWAVQDPATREWRSATDEEYEVAEREAAAYRD